MRHNELICACLLALALLCTACSGGTAGGITAQKGKGLPDNLPTHLTQKLGSEISIDADISVPRSVKTVPVLSAKPYGISTEKLKSVLLGKNEFSRIDNADGSTEYYTSGLTLNDKNGKPLLYGEVSSQPNDRLLICGSAQTIFITTEYNFIYYAFQADPTSGTYGVNAYKHTKSLSFMSPGDAFLSVSQTMKSFGLDVGSVHDTYCLDSATTADINGLDQFTRRISYVPLPGGMNDQLPGKTAYDSHDDFYYFKLYPVYQGIPITEGDGLNIDGGALDVAYSERGIEYLYANTLYQETGVLKPDVEVYGLDGALQALRHKYDQTIIADPVKVTGIRFCYVPVPASKGSDTACLTPVWSFDVNQTVMDITGGGVDAGVQKGVPKTETVKIFFDATNGKELIGSSPRI